MAAAARLLLLLAGCAGAPTVPSGSGDEWLRFKTHFPEFYESLRATMMQQFHAEEVAKKTQLGSGRWEVEVRIDIDYMGDPHGCKLLRSSGFNAVDDEALAACRRLKEHLFPPEGAVEADQYAHCPVQLVLERQ
jgi:TonB family protein